VFSGGSSTLGQYSRDLTEAARKGELDPVIGRDDEVERVVSILARRSKNNPVLIGEPGVGKTAIVEGLAQRIAQGSVPQALRDKRVLALSLGPLVAGTKYRGEFEGRVKKILDEVKRAGRDIILFIDELHTLVGAGAAEGSLDLSSMIKPELARGELQCIGATTFDEISQVRRVRCRPGAPLPAGARRRTDDRADRRHLARPAAEVRRASRRHD